MSRAISVEERLGEDIAAVARGTPGVAGLSTGRFATLSTPVSGGLVEGVAVHPDRVEVGIVAEWGIPLPGIAEEVRSAAAPLAEGRAVDVSIEDLADPAGHDPPHAAVGTQG